MLFSKIMHLSYNLVYVRVKRIVRFLFSDRFFSDFLIFFYVVFQECFKDNPSFYYFLVVNIKTNEMAIQ